MSIYVQCVVSQHAKSVLLWKHYLQLTIRNTSNETEVINIFKESQKHVPEKVKYSNTYYENKQNINPACACNTYLINSIILFYLFIFKLCI
jgi:hypothetical protein